jgi:pimeloyl-ACP methyl ester carboxylesterase
MSGAMDRTAVLGDIRLRYEETGRGEPILFIHGALIADAFRTLVARLAGAGDFRLIQYRRRGYAGSSALTGKTGIEAQAADACRLLRHLGVRRAHVVGHSYGGSIGLQLSLDFPEVVASLTLLEPALLVGQSAEDYRQSLAGAAQRYREAPAAQVVDEFFLPRFGPDYRARLDAELPGAFEQAVSDAGTFFERELPALSEWSFSVGDLARISQPVLAVTGSESERLWPRFSQTHLLLLEKLPQAESFVLPNAMHGLQLDNPAGLAVALLAYWRKHGLTP